MATRWVGERVERLEDERLLTGKGRYLDDLGRDALAGAVVRSHLAHARILSIDVTEAAALDGVEAVYTWADLPERAARPLPLLIPHPDLTHPRTQPVLAKDTVHYVGQAVAFVVARDRYVAEDACELIEVDYEPLPAVVGIEAARRADDLVHDDVPGNLGANVVQSVGDAAAAIEAAPHRLDLTWDVDRSLSSPMEGKGVYARWDELDQKLRLYSSTQTPSGVRAAVASMLGLELGSVDCIAPDVGGGFGVKIVHPWPEEVLVPFAAMALGREVKWVEDRREHFVASTHERAQHHEVSVGFDDDGVVQGLSVRFWHDQGAFVPYGIIVPIVTSTQLPGPYRLREYRVEFDSLYTTTTPVTPYRGAGRPQGVYVMERTLDTIADTLGLDRTVVRERNMVRPDEMPYDLGLVFQDGGPTIYDSGDFPATLQRCKELVDWDGFAARRTAAADEGRRLGIGIACYVEGTGIGPYEGAHVLVEPSGRVMVATGLSTQGQAHETVFAQIAADQLGVDVADVVVTTGDTRRFPWAVGTFASRAAVTSGNAVHKASVEVARQAREIAADALEASPDDLELAEGVVRVRGTPTRSIPLKHVAVLSNPLRYAWDEEAQEATQFAAAPPPVEPGSFGAPPVPEGTAPGLEARDFYSPPGATFANGCHACVVEVDPETEAVTILDYAVVHDCGTLVNPMVVEGQIHGGVAQGVGGALYERLVYDEDGQLLTASFMDFLIPYATEVPEIRISHLQTPSPLNPLGVKGAGEAGVIPVEAAIAAAVEDASRTP
jgi:aerobic carbon-monoxide dehydrogenase large subunit